MKEFKLNIVGTFNEEEVIRYYFTELGFNFMRENKMTRQEALSKIRNISDNHYTKSEIFIKSLEALGLLKFEEEKKEESIAIKTFDNTFCYCSWENVLDALDAKGYTVTKNG